MKTLRNIIFLMLAFFVASCTHSSLKPVALGTGPLYPPGVYQHAVGLEFTDDRGETRKFNLKGVVAFSPPKITVTGLSPFATTVFRVSDDGVLPPKLEVFEDRLRPVAPKLLNNYKLIRDILMSEREAVPQHLHDSDGNDVQVVIAHYDRQNIPRQVWLTAKMYKIRIEVTDYELHP
jgi:hypothetical protein